MMTDPFASLRKNRPALARSITLAAALVGIGLAGCTPVHTLRITNASNVTMAYAQQMGDETNRRAEGQLEPGESVLVKIREGEEISLPDALTIEILGD